MVFSLGMDGFNPFGCSGHSSTQSVTAMYMICLSLSPEIRNLPENMYLVTILPGPTKPALEQINFSLEFLVDQLLEFWDLGVYLSHTAIHAHGVLCRIALIPLVCDLLAARQMAGLTSHSASIFCSFCYLRSEDIENIDKETWMPRDAKTHREHANEWLNATTQKDHDLVVKESGVRSDAWPLPTGYSRTHLGYLGL
jgi:hypothetical protein